MSSGGIGKFHGRDVYNGDLEIRRQEAPHLRSIELRRTSKRVAEAQRTGERLNIQLESRNHRPHAKVISRLVRRISVRPRIRVTLYSEANYCLASHSPLFDHKTTLPGSECKKCGQKGENEFQVSLRPTLSVLKIARSVSEHN